MTTKYTGGGGRASFNRAISLIKGELASGFDFVLGIGAVPSAFGNCALSTARKATDSLTPRVIGEKKGEFVPDVIVEIAPDTTVQASEVVASALAHQATGRRL
jgi:hypothetical protein